VAAFLKLSAVRVKELIRQGLRAGRGNEFMYLTPEWLPKDKGGKYERITCDHAEWIKSEIIVPIHRGDFRPRHPETGEWVGTAEFKVIEAKRSAELLARHPELKQRLERWGIDPATKDPPPWIEKPRPARDTSKFRPKNLRSPKKSPAAASQLHGIIRVR
jgi:hypothetical protein